MGQAQTTPRTALGKGSKRTAAPEESHPVIWKSPHPGDCGGGSQLALAPTEPKPGQTLACRNPRLAELGLHEPWA